MDPNIWIVNLLLTWIISSISCDAGTTTDETVANGQISNVAEFIRHNVDPLTHMEMTADRRPRRAPYSSLFEQGYDDFLRDHFKNSNENERKSNYRAKESESDESSNESNESESDERSEESEEKPKKNQHKGKSNAKLNRQKNHSPAKSKKSKHCKIEKRGNMLCSVCFNPKTDEKSESCSFNSEPKKKNYAYSTDNKYENKNRERESYEKGNDPDDGDDDEENDNEDSDDEEEAVDENDEEKLEIEKGQRIPLPIAPVQRPAVPFNPRFYPPNGPYPNRPLPIRPIPVRPNPNYHGPPRNGPQVFPQQYRGAPVRLQVPPNSAVIRYRTVGSPNGQRHIRIITYPNGQTQTQVYNPGPAQGSQDLRPPRDVNTEQSVLRDITKGLDHFGSGGSNDNQKLADFLKEDWTNCKRFLDTYDNQICFECVKDGSRGKQCMYAGESNKKPESFYKEYSTSKKVENDEPYEFDRPKSSPVKHRTKQKPKPKPKHHRKQKPETVHKSSSNSGQEPAPVYEQNSYDWKGIDYNAKQQRPQAEQLRAGTSDVIYGKIIPGNEPLGLFFNKDFGHFNTTTNAEKTT